MNFQQLEYIIALDQQRHFAKAADSCKVTQPTLSTMIIKLEEELGVKIFDRMANPIQTTEIGKKIIAQAHRILGETHVISDMIMEEKNALTGDLSLGVLPTIAPYLLPKIFPIFQQKLPKVNFNILELKTSECLEALRSNQISLAIIASETDTEGLTDDLLYYEAFQCYVSKNEPLFKEDKIRSSEVDGKRLWLLDEGHCFRDQLVRFCGLKSFTKKKNTYQKGSLQTFMNFVECGQGITFIPDLAVETLSPEQKSLVRPFCLPHPVRQIRLAYRKDYPRLEIVKKIKKIITGVVPKHMLTMNGGESLA